VGSDFFGVDGGFGGLDGGGDLLGVEGGQQGEDGCSEEGGRAKGGQGWCSLWAFRGLGAASSLAGFA
jgi:hypothetical protein